MQLSTQFFINNLFRDINTHTHKVRLSLRHYCGTLLLGLLVCVLVSCESYNKTDFDAEMREKYIKVVEDPRDVAMRMASGSNNNNNRHREFPVGVVKYEHLVADRQLFMTTLEKLHSLMSTKFMIPIIGGRDLDLHKLFVEVTSRGGVEKILREKKWKEVATTFNFPSTATNASFILRKYYFSLLQTFEQIYYFNNVACLSQSSKTPPAPTAGQQPSEVKVEQPVFNTVETVPQGDASPVGSSVIGVIDGKFEDGYLITFRVGTEILRGVMFQHVPEAQNVCQVQQAVNVSPDSPPGIPRKRRRRKKSGLRKRDPSHPKPNISGYNFFFADQHARLRPLQPGKDREISRMIGDLWNNLGDNEKAVYQEKAVQDKERYRTEMEDYRGILGANQVISDAVPIQQFSYLNVNLTDVNAKEGTLPEMDTESSKSETEDENESFSETETSFDVGVESGTNAAGASEISAEAGGGFQVVQEDETMPNSPSEAGH